jgi:UDP-2,4-diacetamido-2,4,6-trideoxy-beta-L-altropyranose hydrolase
MKVAFRADASVDIGTGHVMRCLTLARVLTARGHDCRFICRDLHGHMADRIGAEFPVTLLPAPTPGVALPDAPAHAAWAGVPAAQDAAETRAAVADTDVLVVDHYAFDARWEIAARPSARGWWPSTIWPTAPMPATCWLTRTMAGFRRDYDALMPEGAERLMGTTYALLRPEFAAARDAALARRGGPLREILIAMGGVDRDDATGTVLRALAGIDRPTGAAGDRGHGGCGPASGRGDRAGRHPALCLRGAVGGVRHGQPDGARRPCHRRRRWHRLGTLHPWPAHPDAGAGRQPD